MIYKVNTLPWSATIRRTSIGRSEEVRVVMPVSHTQFLSAQEKTKKSPFSQRDEGRGVSEFDGVLNSLSAANSKARCRNLALRMARGEALTPSEQAYLQKYAPELHESAKRANEMRQRLEQRLRTARSEQERQMAVTQETAMVPHLVGQTPGNGASVDDSGTKTFKATLFMEAIRKAKENVREGKRDQLKITQASTMITEHETALHEKSNVRRKQAAGSSDEDDDPEKSRFSVLV